MNGSEAERLLRSAASEGDRLRRHLLVAAALRDILPHEPVVVGGTAQEFWTREPYHETDLDLCAPVGQRARAALREAGFRRSGRHWVNEAIAVAVEFPEARIDGDEDRTVFERVGSGAARIIGVEDLYLDRVRQATATEHVEGESFLSAVLIAATRYELMDWDYVDQRVERQERETPVVGRSMRRLERLIRARALRAVRDPGSE